MRRVALVVLSVCSLSIAIDVELANANVHSFDSVDYNADGLIDFSEFEKWQKTKLGEADQSIKKTFQRFDANRDDKLEVSEFVPLAYEISQKPIDTAEQIFKQMDLNGDLFVDQAEAETAKKQFGATIIDGVFSVADLNRDGRLSLSEFKSQLTYDKPKSQAEKNRETAAQLMAAVDSNGDNKISIAELKGFVSQYQPIPAAQLEEVIRRLDQNGDGQLSFNELERVGQEVSRLVLRQPPTV